MILFKDSEISLLTLTSIHNKRIFQMLMYILIYFVNKLFISISG